MAHAYHLISDLNTIATDIHAFVPKVAPTLVNRRCRYWCHGSIQLTACFRSASPANRLPAKPFLTGFDSCRSLGARSRLEGGWSVTYQP